MYISNIGLTATYTDDNDYYTNAIPLRLSDNKVWALNLNSNMFPRISWAYDIFGINLAGPDEFEISGVYCGFETFLGDLYTIENILTLFM